ncbi:hypothetical protein Pyn_16750 [Prunus yedoensis var. nudiflora]|uniref:Late embryogenesis abundant protein LEA-2 subgroup domain-containing protein n=1 Tax=Prunus yedoensis var. nudiflora TaxID=2094558 RepID=A0A314YYF1_PRUYE|nr:hypothetical protein Pyn_16750 [Prunus yedoensis var. nudiflora]
MASKGEFVYYAPIPSDPTHAQSQQTIVVLAPYCPNPNYRRRRRLLLCLSITASLLLFSTAIFFLFPSDPTLQLVRLKLNHVRVNSSPRPTLDLSFSLTIRVRNRDLVPWRELGFVSSDGGRVRARGSSYVNATLVLDGLEVIHDVFYLLEDLARGVIPFDTDTEVEGTLGLFFFKIPIKAKASCEVYVNTNSQTIVRQDCCPEVRIRFLLSCG